MSVVLLQPTFINNNNTVLHIGAVVALLGKLVTGRELPDTRLALQLLLLNKNFQDVGKL